MNDNIHIHIERLILDGIDLPARHRPQLQAALEAELGRLLAGGGLRAELVAGGMVPEVQAGRFVSPETDDPAELGRSIARAVYGGIGL